MPYSGAAPPTAILIWATLLPADGDYAYANSYAVSIEGDTVYGLAVDNTGEYYHAIEWNIVPEPGSLMLLGIGALLAGARRRRRV